MCQVRLHAICCIRILYSTLLFCSVAECRDGVEVQLPCGVCDVADAPVLVCVRDADQLGVERPAVTSSDRLVQLDIIGRHVVALGLRIAQPPDALWTDHTAHSIS